MAKFKYFSAFIVPLLGLLTFNTTGYLAYIGIFSLYVLVPVLESILPQTEGPQMISVFILVTSLITVGGLSMSIAFTWN